MPRRKGSSEKTGRSPAARGHGGDADGKCTDSVKKTRARPSYRVYVLLLKASVRDDPKFTARNPRLLPDVQCVYVGCTAKAVDDRIREHVYGAVSKKGRNLSCEIVKRHFDGRYDDHRCHRIEYPSRAEAEAAERSLARELKRQGWGVYTDRGHMKKRRGKSRQRSRGSSEGSTPDS